MVVGSLHFKQHKPASSPSMASLACAASAFLLFALAIMAACFPIAYASKMKIGCVDGLPQQKHLSDAP